MHFPRHSTAKPASSLAQGRRFRAPSRPVQTVLLHTRCMDVRLRPSSFMPMPCAVPAVNVQPLRGSGRHLGHDITREGNNLCNDSRSQASPVAFNHASGRPLRQ